jgi:hypothetical protein
MQGGDYSYECVSNHSGDSATTEPLVSVHSPLLVRTHQLLFGAGKQKRMRGIVVWLIMTESFWTHLSIVMSCAIQPKLPGCIPKPNMDSKSSTAEVICLNSALLLEFWVNISFGSYYCQEVRLLQFVNWVEGASGLPAAKIARSLETCCGVTWVLLFLNVTMYLNMYPNKEWEYRMVMMAADTYFFFVATAPLLYLCMLWLWINTTFYKISAHVADSLTLDMVRANALDKSLHELLEKMESVSDQWALNHTLRLIPTVTSASVSLFVWHHSERRNHFSWPLFYGSLLYLIVWITALAPGFVTDELFRKIQRKLFQLSQHAPHDAIHDVTAAMQRVEIARRSNLGLHFIGVSMTLQKGLSVGSILAFVIQNTLRQ